MPRDRRIARLVDLVDQIDATLREGVERAAARMFRAASEDRRRARSSEIREALARHA